MQFFQSGHINFAKTGNPNGQGLPGWPQYAASLDSLMNFTRSGPKPEPDSRKKQLDLTEMRVRNVKPQ